MEICEKRASKNEASKHGFKKLRLPSKIAPPKNSPSWTVVAEPQEDCQVFAPVC